MKKHLLTLIFISVLGFSYAQPSNHWTTIVGTQYNLTMSGVIYIDDEPQTSTMLEIGAFCGNECRGSARAQYFPPTGDYVVSLTVVSNQQSGETITFRLFDHATQQEFPTESVNSITFNANDNYGEMGNWYPFAFVGEVPEYEITVSANPVEGGTVSGAGIYSEGDLCTLTVMVNDAYTLVNWTKDGIEVSTSPTYSFTVTESASYTANLIEASTANHWTTITGTQYNLTMSGVIFIDGIAQTSTALEIGAFCGNECRGSARAQFFPPTGDYVVSLTVVSNEVNGETITFRLYDHRIQQEFPSECVNSITFNANDNYGEMGNWYSFAFMENTNTIQTVALLAGWNWVSFNAEITMADLQAALLAAYPNVGMNDLVIKSKGEGQTAYNPTVNRWVGSLTTLDLSQMYMVKVPADGEISVEGMPIDPAEHPAVIAPGANWIAFPLGQSMSITDAFAGFPANGDIVKAKGGGQAQWNSAANRWIGALVNAPLQPGQGYMYNSKATGNRTFTFPVSAK